MRCIIFLGHRHRASNAQKGQLQSSEACPTRHDAGNSSDQQLQEEASPARAEARALQHDPSIMRDEDPEDSEQSCPCCGPIEMKRIGRPV